MGRGASMIESRPGRRRYVRPGGRWLAAVPDARRAGAAGRPLLVTPSARASGRSRLARPWPETSVRRLPELALKTCWGEEWRFPGGLPHPTIVYVYPGAPSSPDGGSRGRAADAIEHRAFELSAGKLYERGLRIVGLSSECVRDQRMSVLANRLFQLEELVNDPDLLLASTLGLPTFTHGATAFYCRATLFVDDGRVEETLFPQSPYRCVSQVVAWLKATGRW
jgi:peroxiredoxin